MEHKQPFVMYKIAHQLAVFNGYDVLYMNENTEEIWLEKVEQKKSLVVRISTIGFDWKNHLKKDIAIVFEKTKAMRHLLRGKDVEIHNVYISPHTPIDDWEILKKPMMIQEKKPILMKTYYLSGDELYSERDRLIETLDVTYDREVEILTDMQMEQDLTQFRTDLIASLQEKRKKSEKVFSFGKPLVTYFLIGINAILYLLLEFNGGSQTTETLLQFGAKYNPAIMDGEWWRIFTSMFLHIGLIHFLSNMLFLYYFGSLAERIYGSTRFVIIYLLAGIGGGIASFAFVTNISAGASGALYGMFGAFIYFGMFYRNMFYQTIGKNILVVLALNIGLGFVIPQLDMVAHLGGLVAGIIAAAIVHLPLKQKRFLLQGAAFILYCLLVIGFALWGIQINETKGPYQLSNIDHLLQEERYEEVVLGATNGLKNPESFEAILLFQRSYAYIQLGDSEKAIADLEQCINVLENPEELPQAFYNLALLYDENGDERAIEMIQKAYQLNPTEQRVKELYQTITGNKTGE